MEALSKQGLLRKKLKTRTITLNSVAEFFASAIFSVMYFIFISRYLSDAFSFNYIMLSFAIGLSFFAAIYIPFHTYRIHIIPFISLITALRKRKPEILLHKIPAQIFGSFVGILIFNVINAKTTQVRIEEFQLIYVEDKLLFVLINALTAVLLCYAFYLIRVLFNARQLTGTIYLSLFYGVLFSISALFANVSSLNPFGYFFYDLLGDCIMCKQSLIETLAIHFLIPVAAVLLLLFYIKPKTIAQR